MRIVNSIPSLYEIQNLIKIRLNCIASFKYSGKLYLNYIIIISETDALKFFNHDILSIFRL
jgi:hypothetical protein